MAELQITSDTFAQLSQLLQGRYTNLADAAREFGFTANDLAREVVKYVDSPRYLGDAADVLHSFHLNDREVCDAAKRVAIELQRPGLARKVRRAIRTPRRRSRLNGPALEPYQIILKPLVTEKGLHRSTTHNTYTFEVNRLATKGDIRRAVEVLFGVKVVSVRTQNRKAKPPGARFQSGRDVYWKKALVKLVDDDRIEFI
jgi:large subunit ribosomal protein L23